MSTLLEESTMQRTSTPAQRLRTTMAGVRISFSWLGTRKTLSREQKSQAADVFGADESYVSAAKRILDTSDPTFKAVTAVRHRAASLLRGMSLPFPEPGIRLVRQDDVASLNVQLQTHKAELDEAVGKLDERYEEMQSAARQRLGSLYNAGDYPASLRGEFDLTWDFPNVEAPSYLRQLHPDLYELECRRVQARFDEAVQMAESAFTEELSQLVTHLTERLAGDNDGRPKVFRDSAVSNLREFFDRFRLLNVRSNEQLDGLVSQCQQIVQGVKPQQLRDDGSVRQQVASQLSAVQSTLDGLLVDRPRRRVIRSPK